MKWLRRTDQARRTKGEPPPTTEQLTATIKRQGEIIRKRRHQCDGLITENAELRQHPLHVVTLARGGVAYDEDEQLIHFDPDAARPYIKPMREVEG